MNTVTWLDPLCNRSGWPKGEWDAEPDKMQWVDEATGLACLAKRHQVTGHWCGYVGVPPKHPFYGADICHSLSRDARLDELEVHDGISYGKVCDEGPIESSVCHVPEAGQPDHLYWLGFACASIHDVSPYEEKCRAEGKDSLFKIGSATYKNLAFVRAECARLAAQIHAQI